MKRSEKEIMGKTVGTRILERSIIKHLEKSHATGVGIGSDFSVLSDGKTVLAMGFADEGYDPSALADLRSVSIGEMALIRALNNLACSGVTYSKGKMDNGIDMSIMIQAGANCPEQKLRSEMLFLAEEAKRRGFMIIGGNTVYSSEGDSYSVSISLYGKLTDKDVARLSEKVTVPDQVFIFGFAGHLGASIAATKNAEKLKERLSSDYIKNAIIDPDELEIGEMAREMIDAGAFFIHDVTFGGVYRAYLEAALRYDTGIMVGHKPIPIRQDTIEICEVLGLNPYEQLGTGAFIGAFHNKDEDMIYDKINKLGDKCAVSAILTRLKEKSVLFEQTNSTRSLTYYE